MKNVNKKIMAIALVFSLLVPVVSFAKVKMVPAGFSDLAEHARPAVVNIRTVKTIQGGGRVFNHFFGQPFDDRDFFRQFTNPFSRRGPSRDYKENSLGSGFIIDRKGYIVTNYHVIDGADEILVKMYNDKEYEATVVGGDPKTDLALIKIDAKGLVPLKLGSSDDLKVGTWVVAIGSPFGLEQTVTAGIVSAKGRILGSGPYDDFIQTDASINPGNSGGPLLNLEGEVVGINTAIIKSGQGIGFAIPSDLARGIVKQLRDSGSVTRGWLGVAIQDVTPELAEYYGIKPTGGALVAQVYENNPAHEGGIEPGDIIVKVNDVKIKSSRDLSGAIAGFGVGEKVTVVYLREGQKRKTTVTLARRSDDDRQLIHSGNGFDDLGMKFAAVGDDAARPYGYNSSARGIVVVDIEPGSKADQSGIREGDLLKEVNHRPVKNRKQYFKVMESIAKGEQFQLLFRRGNVSFIAVRLVR
ncbi:serine protease Do [Desulfocicer vacuolatum DSM 3385]|uniref:Probable periplasmic serine endoprotease DegP-like n=1 Tax=Desulfocicer vacuolatum DSM 3385 TaxID=1121400 RepID=A0A1W2C3X2_9BACT|nr:Do family serine endopeptidase [Desulfocicer vacuolatum]SMC79850.1 serine protease Do [Desulfocicer vacuolatum DSM 3385]